MNVLDFSIDPNNRYTFLEWDHGRAVFGPVLLRTDQSQVQRYLSGKSLAESQRGLIKNGFLKIPMQFFTTDRSLGLCLFPIRKGTTPFQPLCGRKSKSTPEGTSLKPLKSPTTSFTKKNKNNSKRRFFSNTSYQAKYLQLEKQAQRNRTEAKKIIEANQPQVESNDKDYVFIYFILNYLPQGLIGLLLAVILSAAMSSAASEINALSATTVVDLYKRFNGTGDEKHYVWAGKGFTLLWGVIAIAFALVGNLFENLIQLVNIIGSLFYGTILGIFLIAIFIKTISANAVFYAAILSEIIVLIVHSQEWVSFLWLNVIRAVLTVLTAVMIQLISKE